VEFLSAALYTLPLVASWLLVRAVVSHPEVWQYAVGVVVFSVLFGLARRWLRDHVGSSDSS